MAKAAESATELKGILEINDERRWSPTDFNHNRGQFHLRRHSDPGASMAPCVRVLSWYDNEWGFSNRMSDTAVAMGKLL